MEKKSKQSKDTLSLQETLAVLQERQAKLEKENYDLQQLVELAKSLTSQLSLERLMESLSYTVMAQMKTTGCALLVRKTFDTDKFVLAQQDDDRRVDMSSLLSLSSEHPALKLLSERDCALCFEDLRALLTPKDTEAAFSGAVGELFGFTPKLFVPLKTKNRLLGILLLAGQIDGTAYSESEKKFVLNVAKLAAVAVHNSLLVEMSTTDIMTRLKLRHYFFTVAEEWLENLNEATPASILMLDIDHFKVINDTYGHTYGDAVLQKVATTMNSLIRHNDLAARYGGEEFVVYLHRCEKQRAVAIAERIRQAVENLEVDKSSDRPRVTISIGVAEYKHRKETLEQLIGRADKALYLAKERGRNNVCAL